MYVVIEYSSMYVVIQCSSTLYTRNRNSNYPVSKCMLYQIVNFILHNITQKYNTLLDHGASVLCKSVKEILHVHLNKKYWPHKWKWTIVYRHCRSNNEKKNHNTKNCIMRNACCALLWKQQFVNYNHKSILSLPLSSPVWPMNNPRHRRPKIVKDRATPVIVSGLTGRTWKNNNNWFA